MNNKLISVLKYLLGWPFSILAMGFIIKLIIPQAAGIYSLFTKINLLFLLYGTFCLIIYFFLRSAMWHFLIKRHTREISYKQSAFFWAISELKRYVPGTIWSFLGRTLLYSEIGVPKKNTLKASAEETLFFLTGCCIISVLSVPFLSNYFFSDIELFPLFIVVIVSILTVGLVFGLSRFKYLVSNFTFSESLFTLFLSSVTVLFLGLGHYFIIGSLIFLNPNLIWNLSGYFALTFLIGIISFIVPAGLGVREGLMIVGLSKIASSGIVALTSVFSRIILIFSELIFLTFSFVIYKTRNKFFLRVEKWIANHKHETILALFFSVFVIYFSITSYARYDNFFTGRFDLGNMVQTVWNTTQGRVFLFTDPNGTDTISRLGFHADFFLVLLAPFYLMAPGPKTLLFIQALAVAFGSIFIYAISKEIIKNKNISLAFAFSYLINPSIQRATLYDFHSVTLATTFLLGTYYFYTKKKYIYFSTFALLSALCKEQIWVIIALFGGLIFIKQKKRLLGASILFVSLAIFYYLISIAIPAHRGSSHFALAYYSELGDGPVSIIKTIILSPQKIMGIIFQENKIEFLNQLFLPLGYLSFIFPFPLIFSSGDFLINLLSNNPQLHQIYYHYTAALSPFIFISAIWGAYLLRRIPSYFLITYLLFFSIFSAYLHGPLPGSKDPNLDMFTKPVENREKIEDYLSKIPQNLSVASSNNAGSHLSQRQEIYILPLGIDKAGLIVFLLNYTESAQSIDAEKEQLKKIKKDKNYELLVDEDPFFVFRKNVYN